jgi:hypothetical protein
MCMSVHHTLLFVQNGGTTTVSMDANFGMVRKFNSGCSPMPPSYDYGFFLDPHQVDMFVDHYKDDSQKDKACI